MREPPPSPSETTSAPATAAPAAQAQDSLAWIRDEARQFAAERDWDQFHAPRNLVAALTVEVAELLEPFQWLQRGDAAELGAKGMEAVRHEMADVLVYLVRLADKLDVDLRAAVEEKMVLNRAKYPVERVRGDARKYDAYPDSSAADHT